MIKNLRRAFIGSVFMYFHGYDRHFDGMSKLLIREIRWDKNGWPVVKL